MTPVQVRLINDATGWTAVVEVAPGDWAGIPVAVVDYVHGGFGQILFKPSGERDAQGRTIFRTREQ